MTARTRCGWFEIRECGELLYGRFPLKLKLAVYKSHIRKAIEHVSETWCLRYSNPTKDGEIHGESNV